MPKECTLGFIDRKTKEAYQGLENINPDLYRFLTRAFNDIKRTVRQVLRYRRS